MTFRPSEIKAYIELAILVLTQGKAIVNVLGEIVREIRSWFVKEHGTVPAKPDEAAVEKFAMAAMPLMRAKAGNDPSVKAVGKALDVLWRAENNEDLKAIRAASKAAAGTRNIG